MELFEYVKSSWPGWVCSAFVPVIAYLYSQVMASRNGVRALLRAEIIRDIISIMMICITARYM